MRLLLLMFFLSVVAVAAVEGNFFTPGLFIQLRYLLWFEEFSICDALALETVFLHFCIIRCFS